MKLRNKLKEKVDFSKGIDAWNKESFVGTSPSGAYTRSHPYNLRPNPEGFVDDIVNLVFDSEGKLIGRGPFLRLILTAPWHPNTARNEEASCCVHRSSTDLLWCLNSSTPLVTPTQFFYNSTTPAFSFLFSAITTNKPKALLYNGFWYIFNNLNTANMSVRVLATSPFTQTAFTPAWAGGVTGIQDFPVLWKDRAWFYSGPNIVWSKATDPMVWAAPDGGFFKINEDIRDIYVYNDTFYILTKSNNVWAFNYDSDPGTDGYLRKIIDSSAMPGGAYGNFCVSDGYLFVTGATNVYRIVNNNPIAIADQLHLDLNGHDGVSIWDLGAGGLLLRTYYQNSGRRNQDLYVYNHKAQAWTRVSFEPYTTEALNDSLTFNDAWLDTKSQYSSSLFIFWEGSSGDVAQGVAYNPIYRWYQYLPYFDENNYDAILNSWDGNGTRIFKQVKHKIDTGVLYQKAKDEYKRYWNFLFDAFLGFRQQGDTPNLTPYKTTVDFVPQAMADKVSSTIQRTPETMLTEVPYVVPINQRARGVRLIFETEDLVTTAVYPSNQVPSTTVDTRPVINELTLIYEPIENKRYLTGAAANTDAGTV